MAPQARFELATLRLTADRVANLNALSVAYEKLGAIFADLAAPNRAPAPGKRFTVTLSPPSWTRWPPRLDEIVSVRSGPKDKIEARSFGERPEVTVSREKRNASVNTALGDQRIAEARFAALCQHHRSQPSCLLPVSG